MILFPPWFSLAKEPKSPTALADQQIGPLREFVYLDEGSLRSLLSSQVGEIKDAVSQQSQASVIDEMNLKLSGGLPFAATGEASAKLHNASSRSLQTSSKATVQSWFKDLHDRSSLRLISPLETVQPFDRLDELAELDNPSVASASPGLKRGVLAEFRVRLSAHPVFHLTTMMTEFTGMAAEIEEIVPDASAIRFSQIQPMVRVLQRLMAGLVPILGEAIDHVVVEVAGIEYVVDRRAVAGFDVATRPLLIAGVTDAQSYWKDLRQVLFAEAEFTMLCRVSRQGLQEDWMPVKLVDVFRKIVPDFPHQISMTWNMLFGAQKEGAVAPPQPLVPPTTSPLEIALRHYSDALLASSRRSFTAEARSALALDIDREIRSLKERGGSVSDQKSAFTAVKLMLREAAGVRVKPDQDQKLRDEARALAGLSMTPTLSSTLDTAGAPELATPAAQTVPSERRAYLDAEVVAIYW